jgi:polypeptide N-acetylgalactosaminyltransferase
MSLHRSLPDIRFPKCQRIKYSERLPKVSIIIIFHNEAWSLVTRTIWSIIDHTPPELLHEIILVDDVSTLDFLKRPLEDYVELLPGNIKIIRTKQRAGLIRARLIGAKNATVNIFIYSVDLKF